MNPADRPNRRRPACLYGQKSQEAEEGPQQKFMRHFYAGDFLVRAGVVLDYSAQQFLR
ncbi:hypothetical protein G3I72_03375 [Pseudomonas aeruginosa]|nr:hypothetical protein [Pseudomonas aeruginosa]